MTAFVFYIWNKQIKYKFAYHNKLVSTHACDVWSLLLCLSTRVLKLQINQEDGQNGSMREHLEEMASDEVFEHQEVYKERYFKNRKIVT